MTRGIRTVGEGPNPSGLCECGCGRKTTLAPFSNSHWGDVVGKPRRFIRGHARRGSPVEYLIDDATGCWNWQLFRRNGYGVKNVGNRMVPAHRWMYERLVGPVAQRDDLHHICENRACVNPAHLKPLSPAEHVELRSTTKLTREVVFAIRAAKGTQREIAKRFGISQTHVRYIKLRKTWAHV